MANARIANGRDLEEGSPLIRPSRNSLIRSSFRGLYWENLRVDVVEKTRKGFTTTKTPKTILKNVSGSVEKGRFLAVMGSSGAGKSTLLNLLASRLAPTAGQVYYNSTPLASVPNLNQRLAYVMQEDVLLNTLSVREALTFSALLRLHGPKDAKLRRVEEVLNELGLRRCAETRIGRPSAGGISGGERKRLAIAIELIHDPPILMLDEPTSGLDSFTAESVITTLRRLAEKGRTVVATIHQPSSEVFAMFDSLLLLAHGSVVYQGDAKEVVSYFAELGYKLPELTNPADYFMRVLRMDSTGPGDEASLKADDRLVAAKFINAYEDYSTRTGRKGANLLADGDGTAVSQAGYATGFFEQFFILFRRCALATTREPMTGWVRVFQTVFMAIVYSAIYPRLGLDQSGVLSRMGAIFFLITNQAMGPLFGILNTFPQERTLIQREKENGMYRLSSYYLGKVMIELPLQGIFPIVFVAVVYYIINFRNAADAFAILCLIVTLMSWTASGLGLAISAICPNLNVALAVGPLFILPFMLFGGFLTSDGSIPAYFKWLNVMSFFRMAFQASVINEFRGYDQKFCEEGQRCAYPDKEAVFDAYGVNADQLWSLIIGLAAYTVGLRILAYVFLIFSTRSRIVTSPSE